MPKSTSDTLLQQLASVVREEQDRMADPLRLARVRAQVVNAPAPRSHSMRHTLFACASIACAVFVWLHFVDTDVRSLSFSTEHRTRAVGELLVATQDLSVDFSDGSQINLGEGSEARVAAVTDNGATVRLRRGRARVSVVHRSKSTRWQVQAGPYEVHVIGTRFSVSWDPKSTEFAVQMHEGKVQVRGPDGFHQVLKDQASLRRKSPASAILDPVEAEPEEDSSAEPLPVLNLDVAAVDGVYKQERAVTRPTNASTERKGGQSRATEIDDSEGDLVLDDDDSSQPTSRRTWREDAADGQYALAADKLTDAALRGAFSTGNVQTLALMAKVLRRSSDPRAFRAYLALRKRFGNTSSGRMAAFFLAREYVARQDYAEAEDWFRIYLKESPRGLWHETAHGRLLEVLKAQGQDASSEAAAYLVHHPDGAHATLARELSNADP